MLSLKHLRFSLGVIGLLISQIAITSAQTPGNVVYGVDWNPDGSLLAIGAENGLWFYHPQDQSLEFVSDALSTGIWSTDGSRLFSGLSILNVETRQVEATIQITEPIASIFAWSKDEQFLLARIDDLQNIGVFSTQTGKLIRRIEVNRGEITDIDWSPNETHFAVTIPNGSVLIVSNANTPSIVEYPQNPFAIRVSWSPDGELLAIGTVAQTVVVWNTISQQTIHTFTGQGANQFDWSSDGNRLVASNLDGTLTVWDIETGETLDQFQTFGYLFDADFNPYGGTLALATDVKNALLYKETPMPQSLSINNQARLVQSIGEDGAVQIFAPAPSLERLNTIMQQCGLENTVLETLQSDIIHDQLADFIQKVEQLKSDNILPACAADLIAVAEVLQVVQ